jgi:HSP20 family protein
MSHPTYFSPVDTVMDRMLGLGRAVDQALATGGPTRRQLWVPALDTYETEDAYVVEVDLPGVHAENVELGFERGTLTISGSRAATLPAPSQGQEQKQLRVHVAERTSGTFARAVRLPEYVDGEKIEASLTDGVLHVRIPKATGALARKIAVRAGAASNAEVRRIDG